MPLWDTPFSARAFPELICPAWGLIIQTLMPQTFWVPLFGPSRSPETWPRGPIPPHSSPSEFNREPKWREEKTWRDRWSALLAAPAIIPPGLLANSDPMGVRVGLGAALSREAPALSGMELLVEEPDPPTSPSKIGGGEERLHSRGRGDGNLESDRRGREGSRRGGASSLSRPIRLLQRP